MLFFILNFGYFIENSNEFIISYDGKYIKIEPKKWERFVFEFFFFFLT